MLSYISMTVGSKLPYEELQIKVDLQCMVGTGSYQTIWGPSLPNITPHSGWWPFSVTPSIDQAFHQLFTLLQCTDLDLITELTSTMLSTNNLELESHLGQMYPVGLEIKGTIESNTSASNLDLLLSIWKDGQFYTIIYDKKVDFTSISKIFRSWVSIHQLRAPTAFLSRSLYDIPGLAHRMNVILRATQLSNKLLEQEHVTERLKSSLKKVCGRYGDLSNQYDGPLWRNTWGHYVAWPNIMTTFTTGVAYWQGTLIYLDTLLNPILDLHMFYLLRSVLFPNLS